MHPFQLVGLQRWLRTSLVQTSSKAQLGGAMSSFVWHLRQHNVECSYKFGAQHGTFLIIVLHEGWVFKLTAMRVTFRLWWEFSYLLLLLLHLRLLLLVTTSYLQHFLHASSFTSTRYNYKHLGLLFNHLNHSSITSHRCAVLSCRLLEEYRQTVELLPTTWMGWHAVASSFCSPGFKTKETHKVMHTLIPLKSMSPREGISTCVGGDRLCLTHAESFHSCWAHYSTLFVCWHNQNIIQYSDNGIQIFL